MSNEQERDAAEAEFDALSLDERSALSGEGPKETYVAGWLASARARAQQGEAGAECPECGSDDPKYAIMPARLLWTGETECGGFDFHNGVPPPPSPQGRGEGLRCAKCGAWITAAGCLCGDNHPVTSTPRAPESGGAPSAWAVFNRFRTAMLYADNEPAARQKCDSLNSRPFDFDDAIPYSVVPLYDQRALDAAKEEGRREGREACAGVLDAIAARRRKSLGSKRSGAVTVAIENAAMILRRPADEAAKGGAA